MQSFNCAGALLLQRTFTFRSLSYGSWPKESSDQYSWHIAGSLVSINVFLFARDLGRDALATNPYNDVLLASN